MVAMNKCPLALLMKRWQILEIHNKEINFALLSTSYDTYSPTHKKQLHQTVLLVNTICTTDNIFQYLPMAPSCENLSL